MTPRSGKGGFFVARRHPDQSKHRMASVRTSLDSKYAKWDKVEDYEPDEDEVDAALSEAELKAKREKERDELIQKELDSHKEIDEKLKRAEKLPKVEAAEYVPPVPEATSWSSGRESAGPSAAEKAAYKEKWATIEALLAQLAGDEDFQRDLKRPSFEKALRHWTNEARLPPDEAAKLFDEESFEFRQVIRPGLTKLSRLQAACRAAGIGVPIEALRKGRTTVYEPPPKPPTEEEKREIEKKKRQKAREDFERAVMADLPERQPFSWKKLGRQLLIQILLMSGIMLYFHFVMRPDFEKKMEQERRQQTSTSFLDDHDDTIRELGSDDEF